MIVATKPKGRGGQGGGTKMLNSPSSQCRVKGEETVYQVDKGGNR